MSIATSTLSASRVGLETHFWGNHQRKGVATSSLPQSSINSARSFQAYYSSMSVTLQYRSQDGDTVNFSAESVRYLATKGDIVKADSRESMSTFIKYISERLDALQKNTPTRLRNGIDINELETVPFEVRKTTPEPPDYWNAAATSQRIVDFATSFYDSFGGTGEEFLSVLKNAIDEGFNQAREIMGELPEYIGNLIDTTYFMAMDKLTEWAENNGIPALQSDALAT